MTSWEDVERMIASGDASDTLGYLQGISKLLESSKQVETPEACGISGLDDDVLEFHYMRSFPVDELNLQDIKDKINQNDYNQFDTGNNIVDNINKSRGILTMSSRKYVDVSECFSPIFAGPECLKDEDNNNNNNNNNNTPINNNENNKTNCSPLPTNEKEIILSLKGRSKDEIVPLLISLDNNNNKNNISTEQKVDIALQFFASMK